MKKKKYVNGTQAVPPRPLPPTPPRGMTGGQQVAEMLAGAGQGAASGGWIGAIVGTGLSLFTQQQRRKAEEEQYEEAIKAWRGEATAYQQDKTKNQDELAIQRMQAENGLVLSQLTPVEVERNETIFERNPNTGKWKLKADFVGGKRHDQGGEDYIASAGDVIVPANKRSKALKAYEQGDTATLEGIRMSLPKEGTMAAEGLNLSTDPPIRNADANATLEELIQQEQGRKNSPEVREQMANILKSYIENLGNDPNVNAEQILSLANAYKLNINKVMNGRDWEPNSSDYNYDLAIYAGLTPDANGKWPSRIPETGQIIKGTKHPTYKETIKAENKLGNRVITDASGEKLSLDANQQAEFDSLADKTAQNKWLKQQAEWNRTNAEQALANMPEPDFGASQLPKERNIRALGETGAQPTKPEPSFWDKTKSFLQVQNEAFNPLKVGERTAKKLTEDPFLLNNLSMQLNPFTRGMWMSPNAGEGFVGNPIETQPIYDVNPDGSTTLITESKEKEAFPKKTGGGKKDPMAGVTSAESTGFVGPNAGNYSMDGSWKQFLSPLAQEPGTPAFNLQTQEVGPNAPNPSNFQNFWGNNKDKIMQAAGYIGQTGGALANIFTGDPEVQNSGQVSFDRLQYEDTSDYLRRQAMMNEKVAASNARNLSGGNVQNYRQNRRMAGIAKQRDLENINAQEYNKLLAIANQNQLIGKEETMYNKGLRMQDEQVNAANRAAARNSRIAGINQLGEIGAMAVRDKVAYDNEKKLMKTLESNGVFIRNPDGSITLNLS